MPVKSYRSNSSNTVTGYFRQQYKGRAEQVMAEAAVLELVRQHTLSMSKGAELLGVPIASFLELMNEHGLPYFTESQRPLRTLVAQQRRLRSREA
ncbi:MAG: UPF0175 family protein [Patescibacteria group bacterium]